MNPVMHILIIHGRESQVCPDPFACIFPRIRDLFTLLFKIIAQNNDFRDDDLYHVSCLN